MDFDEMLETWRGQDEKPLYGVNGDLLRLVLQNERATIRRTLRRDQWITYIAGPGMAVFAAFWLWVLIVKHGPLLQSIAAGIGAVLLVLWVGAFWLSRRRQAKRERGFGNSLKDEIGRNLSLTEYQIANSGWRAAVLWALPVMISATLIYWLTFQINTSSGFSWWNHALLGVCIVWSVGLTGYGSARQVRQTLGPRRDRLRHLLDTLEAGE